MTKRITVTALWFLAAWVAGAILSFATGVTPALAPLAALTAAILVGIDPAHAVWSRDTKPHRLD